MVYHCNYNVLTTIEPVNSYLPAPFPGNCPSTYSAGAVMVRLGSLAGILAKEVSDRGLVHGAFRHGQHR